jgi:hypothetical protein
VTLLACSRAETARPATDSASTTTAVTAVETPAGSASGQEQSVTIRDYETRVGVAHVARDSAVCLTIANDELLPGGELILLSLERPQRLTHARVGERRSSPCSEPGDQRGNVDMTNASFYKVEILGDTLGSALSIAIVGPAPAFAVRGDALASDLDGDGREERFAQCASQEGIHLSIVTPGVGAGSRRWHQYFYVPYDLEADCPDAAP